MMFSAFDFADLNQAERESSVNTEAFKSVVADMIRERRAELEDPACTTKGHVDFLSQLLQDDYFKTDDQKILDECMTFIGAATQSQTFLITNTLYYLAKNQEVREKLMAELKVKLMPLVPPGASLQDETTWHTILTQESLDSCPYLL